MKGKILGKVIATDDKHYPYPAVDYEIKATHNGKDCSNSFIVEDKKLKIDQTLTEEGAYNIEVIGTDRNHPAIKKSATFTLTLDPSVQDNQLAKIVFDSRNDRISLSEAIQGKH